MLESDKQGACYKCLNYQQPDKKLFTNTVGIMVTGCSFDFYQYLNCIWCKLLFLFVQMALMPTIFCANCSLPNNVVLIASCPKSFLLKLSC